MKQSFLAREIGPVGIEVHRAIKRALDPAGLFNPGSMFSMAMSAGTADRQLGAGRPVRPAAR